ncbi:hypothetical protein [robinz microvirus RP_153]|nr:hypothetical protein [robinz microvirus RP_153]
MRRFRSSRRSFSRGRRRGRRSSRRGRSRGMRSPLLRAGHRM